MTKIILCSNCLGEDDVRSYEVGPEQGNQYDNWRERHYLCVHCRTDLTEGNFTILAARNKTKRTIKVTP